MSRERHISLREGHQHADAEAFFTARPDLGTDQHRMLFEQGYKRGFDAGVEVGEAQKVASDMRLVDIIARDGGVNIGLEGGACALLAEAFATQFRDSGGENYLEVAFTSKEIMPGERFVVTLQRAAGKTPAELQRAAEAERDRAERRACMFGDVIENHTYAMQAAVIEQYAGGGAETAMAWILNTLAGPGHMPDLDAAVALPAAKEVGPAQAWFDMKMAEHDAFRAAHPMPNMPAKGAVNG